MFDGLGCIIIVHKPVNVSFLFAVICQIDNTFITEADRAWKGKVLRNSPYKYDEQNVQKKAKGNRCNYTKRWWTHMKKALYPTHDRTKGAPKAMRLDEV